MESKHPSGDVLKLYSLDHLDQREKARLQGHLSKCAECRHRVSSLAGTPELTAIADCRRLFLRAAASHPKIRLADRLRERVLIPGGKLLAELNLPDSQWEQDHWIAHERWMMEEDRLMRIWAADLNLDFQWVRREALNQLQWWRSFPQIKKAFTGSVGYAPRDFWLEAWYFEHEPEGLYRKRMKAAFLNALDSHIREVKKLRGQLLPDRGSQAAHYRWAAEHVCLGWTWDEIVSANGTAVTWQAVRKAVLPILRKIGIPEVQPKRRKNSAS